MRSVVYNVGGFETFSYAEKVILEKKLGVKGTMTFKEVKEKPNYSERRKEYFRKEK